MVTFFEAVKLTFARRFNSNCRISRAEFWWMQILVAVYAIITFGIALLASYAMVDPYIYYSESAYIEDLGIFTIIISPHWSYGTCLPFIPPNHDS